MFIETLAGSSTLKIVSLKKYIYFKSVGLEYSMTLLLTFALGKISSWENNIFYYIARSALGTETAKTKKSLILSFSLTLNEVRNWKGIGWHCHFNINYRHASHVLVNDRLYIWRWPHKFIMELRNSYCLVTS